ncbi:MAG TPA: Lrp/AsnC ligand binding domain-containing protein [Streptosporangiaceae bacterium]|nr:Lrp/AsnC ligand binding domain-containing protein [Streptosporangiaceae bacterium]
MIAAYILIQAEPGKVALVAAVLRGVPGVLETASVAGPYDVIARAQAPDIDELVKLAATSPRSRSGPRSTTPQSR